MSATPLRLGPGIDLRRALEAWARERGLEAAFVVAGIGSLGPAVLRFAGADEALVLDGPSEIVALSGSVSIDGSHLHAALALADGRVLGGHLAYGSIVRTTAELLIESLDDWRFTREHDDATGYAELAVRARAR